MSRQCTIIFYSGTVRYLSFDTSVGHTLDFFIQEDLENLSLQEEINEQSSARIKITKVLKVKIWNRFFHQRRIMYCVFYFYYLLLKMQVQHSVLKHGACKMFEYRVLIKYWPKGNVLKYASLLALKEPLWTLVLQNSIRIHGRIIWNYCCLSIHWKILFRNPEFWKPHS